MSSVAVSPSVPNATLRALAITGAKIRLVELEDERRSLHDFIDGAVTFVTTNGHANGTVANVKARKVVKTVTVRTVKAEPVKSATWTPAARRAVSRRMKKYWKARRHAAARA